MKTKLLLLILLMLPFRAFLQNTPEAEQAARKFLDHFLNKEVHSMNEMFTDEFKSMVPAEQIEQITHGLEKQIGKFSHIKRMIPSSAGGYQMFTFVAQFGQMDFAVNVNLDSDLKVAGFNLTMAPPETFTPAPSYAVASRFSEKEMLIDAGDIKLPAMLTMPVSRRKVPLVILVHGSGAHDMDETLGPNKIFRDIAQGLASEGIAVLRYEKRNYRNAHTLDPQKVTVWEEAGQDAVHAIRQGMKLKGIDPGQVYVAGHSLGGMIAPRIAREVRRLKGIISLAGSPRYLSDIITQQYEYLYSISAQQSDQAREQVQAAFEFAADMQNKRNDQEAVYDQNFMNIPAFYWGDLNRTDIGAIAASIPQKILIIQGGRDYQVTMTDFEAWKKALANHQKSTFLLFEDLDHLFVKGEGMARPENYFKENNVDLRVIQAMANWIKDKK
jgi:uncharacterized protein